MAVIINGDTGLTSPAAVLTTTPLAVTSGGTGVTTSTGTGAVVLGTSPTLATPTFDSAQLPTISGTAPLYMCRAWVNFNGTGTVAIRASGNVSSITDTGTGNYTVNFTTALVDANYNISGSCFGAATSTYYAIFCGRASGGANTQTVSAVQITTCYVSSTAGDGLLIDHSNINVAIFR